MVSLSACALVGAWMSLSRQAAPAQHEGPSDATAQARPADDRLWQALSQVASRSVYEMLTPAQRDLAARRLALTTSEQPVLFCFAPDTPPEIVSLLSIGQDGPTPRYNQTSRWSSTASGGTGGVGDPITLTYSFPPDGTVIPFLSAAGFPEGINDFNAWMNSLYGTPATWQALFAQVFARWSQLCGITYVYEPNDDGVNMHQNPGVLGVRGDLRIGGKFLDGNSGVLAYNNFPDDGDMCFDSFDSFYGNLGSNSLRLRNVAAHEHGHGMGQLHVCPVEQTKLMEPFISLAYDGPRHDDVRNAMRHYGDPFEPNETIGTATDMGALSVGGSLTIGAVPAPAIPNTHLLALEADGQSDYFRFTLEEAAEVVITVTPLGHSYDDSNQTGGGCQSGNIINSQNIAKLAITLVDTNGLTVLATALSQPLGSPETLEFVVSFPGTYYIRVFEVGTPSESQIYQMQVQAQAVPFLPLAIAIAGPAPSVLSPGVATPFDVVIASNDEQLVPGSQQLRYRYNGGAFLSAPLAHDGGNNYIATLPPATCGDQPEFYVEASGTISGLQTSPADGPAAPLIAIVTTGFDEFVDNFETEQGWTVSGNATDGHWDRGVPINCDRGDPPSDSDGSGQCRLTDNSAADGCNSDVDGVTTITSPPFDMIDGGFIAYDYWLYDEPNPIGPEDFLRVEVATNAAGTNWQIVRTYTSAAEIWQTDTIAVGTEVPASATLRLRITAADNNPGDVLEAGFDNLRISANICDPVVQAPAAPTGLAASDGTFCDRVALSWNASAGADSYDVFRNSVDISGTAELLASGLAVTQFDDLTAPPGASRFYWVKACNGGGCSDFSANDTGFADAVPPLVTNLDASDSECGVVELTWTAAPGADEYDVFRNTVNDEETATSIGTTPQTSLDDGTAVPGQTYFYWVAAANTCGSGAKAGPATGVNIGNVPTAPLNVAASDDVPCAAVLITWTAAPGATSYNVHRSIGADPQSSDLLGSTGDLFFEDFTGTPDQAYNYWITAANDCGTSGFSTPDSGVRDAGVPGDLNGDQLVNGIDVSFYTAAVLTDPFYHACGDLAAPFGVLDDADTAAFVGLLLGQ